MRFSQCIPLMLGAALLLGCEDQGPSNLPPIAAFTVACDALTCHLTDASTDAGGSVASRAWNFGDGQTSAEQNPTHTYASPGGRFTVTLTVTDDDGARATAAKQINVVLGSGPYPSGTYERETPHRVPGRHSRYVIRSDGTFELRDSAGAATTIYSGQWTLACCWDTGGSLIIFDFFDFHDPTGVCGEAYGTFLLDGHMGIGYCYAAIQAGLEEGVYTTASLPTTPGPPPPRAGQIAFVRDGRIYLANSDGSGLVPLAAGSAPAWSPDGTRIAFTDTTGIFIMDADGGNVVQRTTSGGDPTWSPDGAWIAFSCRDVEADICVVPADGDVTPPVNVTHQGGIVDHPAWSPDGTRIAYTSDWAWFDFWVDIWVVAPDGSGRTALTTRTASNPYGHYQPAWSPDGRRIAFLTCTWSWNYCTSSAVSVMNADGSDVARLVAASGFAGPTWSPDGQLIAFASSNAIEWMSADGKQRGRIIDNGHSPAWRP